MITLSEKAPEKTIWGHSYPAGDGVVITGGSVDRSAPQIIKNMMEVRVTLSLAPGIAYDFSQQVNSEHVNKIRSIEGREIM